MGQRLINLVRGPRFRRYLASGDYDQSIELPGPVNSETCLTLKICAYGSKKRLLLVRDVTQLNNLETMRRDFVSNISHELRTPLIVLKGCVEMIDYDDIPPPPQWHRSLQLIDEQSDRMNDIVRGLLLLSRIESAPRPETLPLINMTEFIADIVTEMDQYKIDKKQTIECFLDADFKLHEVVSEVRSVVTNLIANAINYSPEGKVAWLAYVGFETRICSVFKWKIQEREFQLRV